MEIIFLQSAFTVAILNIWIPQCMGGVINVVAKLAKSSDGIESTGNNNPAFSMLEKLAEPAYRLARMYVAQVCKYRVNVDLYCEDPSVFY